MSEERKGRELLPEELELVNGGTLSQEELDGFLEQFGYGSEMYNVWDTAIDVLRNYPGYSYSGYQGISDKLAHMIVGIKGFSISESEMKKILLQAYKQFYHKIYS